MRKFFAAIQIAVSAIFLVDSVHAAQIEKVSSGGVDAIVIVGELQFEDRLKFIQLALGLESAVVFLSSPGGNLKAGIEIGKAIRMKGFHTAVPDSSECASACALVWLGGARRVLVGSGKVGFHAAYKMEAGAAIESGMANAMVGAYLNTLGLSETAIIAMTSARPDQMTWVTAANANSLGIGVETLPGSTKKTAPKKNARAASVPKFKDYAVGSRFEGDVVPVIVTSEVYRYRTRILRAAQQRPNFGGKYILTLWGCGASCLTGAVIDATTGRVTFLPFTICCATPGDAEFKAVEFRENSTLIVFAGLLNEAEPMGAHFFHFDGTQFKLLSTIEDDGTFLPN